MKTIGIIGITGRMGCVLTNTIKTKFDKDFKIGVGFNKSQILCNNLKDVFEKNDYIVDFSSSAITELIFKTAILKPKPLIVCTTGWNKNKINIQLHELAKIVPVIIAPNTSIGAYLQYYLTEKLTNILDTNYDIDIIEKHHRNKIDCPSGTAISLIKNIKKNKKKQYNLKYKTNKLIRGPRPKNCINLSIERSGNITGEHTVNFTSTEEMISIKHVAFNRILFAKGVIKILKWLNNTKPQNKLYTFSDIFNMI